MHVERVGRGGPPIVLLHGFATCAFLWRVVAPTLANAGNTVLSFDLMGYGESDRPEDAGYGIVAQAEHIDRALTALRLPRALVVGQDVGAIIALQLAARRPERVERLMLLNPPDPTDLPGPAIRAVQRAAARIALGVHGHFVTGQVLSPFLRGSVADEGHMSELLVARYMAPFVGGDGLSHLLMLARSLELEEDDAIPLASVRAPVLFALGEKDESVNRPTINAMAAELSTGAASARVETVANAGALVAEDVPHELARLIGDWINAPVVERVESAVRMGELSPE